METDPETRRREILTERVGCAALIGLIVGLATFALVALWEIGVL